MIASKFFVSAAAAAAVVGVIGMAYAQTASVAPAASATTESTPVQAPVVPSTSVGNTAPPPDTRTMSTDRDVRADRN